MPSGASVAGAAAAIFGRAAYNHHDEEAQKLWDMMTFKGDRPTPEEFIFQVAMMMDEGRGLLH